MNAILPLVAAIGLGVALSWLASRWLGLFDSSTIGAAVWVGACIVIAIIYDRRQARLRRANEAQQSDGTGPES